MDRRAEPVTGRLTFLLTSPRVAPGLLSKDAWAAVAAADAVYAGDPAAPVAQALWPGTCSTWSPISR